MFKRILVAIDDSAPAGRALGTAVELAMLLQARLALLHVVDTTEAFVPEIGYVNQEYLSKLRAAGKALLSRLAASLPRSIHAEQLTMEGDPAETILNSAREWNADLIVIGSDSRGRLAHFLLGSTADSVIRKALCPVLSVRAGALVREESALLLAKAST